MIKKKTLRQAKDNDSDSNNSNYNNYRPNQIMQWPWKGKTIGTHTELYFIFFWCTHH